MSDAIIHIYVIAEDVGVSRVASMPMRMNLTGGRAQANFVDHAQAWQ